MGEITEALRRARAKQPDDESAPAPEEPAPQRNRKRLHRSRRSQPEPAVRHAVDSSKVGEWPARAIIADEGGPLAESCRHLALRLRRRMEERGARDIAIVGPLRNEGKSTVACDLAMALASLEHERQVAIVDFDLRRPTLANVLGLPVEKGVDDYLEGNATLDEVRCSLDNPPLDVFPARKGRSLAHKLLVRGETSTLVAELRERYAAVVYDTPPMLLLPDAELIVGKIDGFVAVARFGKTRRRSLEQMLDQIGTERLLGAVLNEGPMPRRQGGYGYYLEATDEESQ